MFDEWNTLCLFYTPKKVSYHIYKNIWRLKMGKDLNGKELGRGITQRKDGRYMGRIHIRGSKKEVTLYDRNLKMLKNKVNTYRALAGTSQWDISMTVTEWFEQWMEIYNVPVLKATTIRNYWDGFKRIQPLIGDRRVIDIKSNNILSALYVLKENGYAPATIKQTFTILKVMFSMAYRVRAVLYNPCEGMRAPTERTHQEIIEREESQNLEKDVQRFLDVCRHTRYYELFYILSRTGLRIGEACALEWKDVDLERKCIYIDKTVNKVKKYYDSKGRKMESSKMVAQITSPKKQASYRIVPISDETVNAFAAWKTKQLADKQRWGRKWGIKNELLKDFPDLIFTTSPGKTYLPGYATQECKRISDCINRREKQMALSENRESGFIHIHPHLFRYFYVTKCVEKGMNPVMIGKITGHAEIRMTQHYTRLSDEFILRQHEVH
ncbi:site-specific integrase [Blautia sp. 2744]|nr:site-specific integrase [Blautia obeum]MBC5739693.1 site-specific integrase [Blautia intestinalis]